MLEAALAYASAGWPVFPCNPTQGKGGKRPLVAGADKDEQGNAIPKTGGLWRASTDEAQIRAWWGKYPKALIGVPTGARIGLFVVDLDPRSGECVDEVRARLEDAVGPLPETPISVTQSGGWHLWFKNPIGEELPKNSAARIPGVDWRGEGGYVIVPPSAMSDGKAYSWLVAPQ
jgi:putative DNA primase/helicase